jgi:hypothetical protein
MYIITHLFTVKDFWNLKFLKQILNIFLIFKILEFHIILSMTIFWMGFKCSYHLYFFQWIFKNYMNHFDSPWQNWLTQ